MVLTGDAERDLEIIQISPVIVSLCPRQLDTWKHTNHSRAPGYLAERPLPQLISPSQILREFCYDPHPKCYDYSKSLKRASLLIHSLKSWHLRPQGVYTRYQDSQNSALQQNFRRSTLTSYTRTSTGTYIYTALQSRKPARPSLLANGERLEHHGQRSTPWRSTNTDHHFASASTGTSCTKWSEPRSNSGCRACYEARQTY